MPQNEKNREMKKFLRRPALHFLVLGSALFVVLRWLDPPPLPSVGPLPASSVENLKKQWFSTTGRVPSEQQLTGMISSELDREMLFREGLELEIYQYDSVVRQRLIRNMNFLQMAGDKNEDELFKEALRMELHLGDEVVKRRLIQVMEQLLLVRYPPLVPTEEDLQLAFEQRREELRRPVRYTINHVYLTRDRELELAAVAENIRLHSLAPEAAREFSSPFLPGYRFVSQSPQQLARNFGAGFVLNLEALDPQANTWVGPVESTYGFHLVWIEQLQSARDARLDEVQQQLLRDLKLERRREALRDAVAVVREGYEVIQ
jgi:hypothetical protein